MPFSARRLVTDKAVCVYTNTVWGGKLKKDDVGVLMYGIDENPAIQGKQIVYFKEENLQVLKHVGMTDLQHSSSDTITLQVCTVDRSSFCSVVPRFTMNGVTFLGYCHYR